MGAKGNELSDTTPREPRPGALTQVTDIAAVIDSARRLGVELDEGEAGRWLDAMESEAAGGDVVVDVDSGVFGHRVTMLDFSPHELARFRSIAGIVGFEDRPGEVLTALALSGSAAQSRVQAYPGDCDFFERVHIIAPSRDEARRILADVIRQKALSTTVAPAYRLTEVRFGSYPFDGTRDGKPIRAGGSITWSAREVAAGGIELTRTDGTAAMLSWEEAAAEPGWCKLDWVVCDPIRRRLANASNMLDVTWEAPDGTITPLDGFIDPYFQEVYLEAESLPLFSRLVKELSADSVAAYVDQLEHEIRKYTTEQPNWGKAARRMYNLFRLTGRYAEAAYLRELFDEPATILYQVAALVRTIDEAAQPGAAFATESMVAGADELIMSAVAALEGRAEAEMVRHLLRIRDTLARPDAPDRTQDVHEVSTAALDAVNGYFRARLEAVPGIREYLEDLAAPAT